MSASRQHAIGTHPEPAGAVGTVRGTVEFLVALALGILIARHFVAEAYIVPTGSMAPALLGRHQDLSCPACGLRFAVGIDEDGRPGRPVCPNCGRMGSSWAEGVESEGDRLLVQKYLFDLRPPRRWEMAVFQSPEDPSQAYVKRVVGLPGESVEIRGGDVYIDGRIARKDLAEARALGIPVFEGAFVPDDAGRAPRWTPLRADRPSGWEPRGPRLVHRPGDGGTAEIDWIEYHHLQPVRDVEGPVRDFYAYNGAELPGDFRVGDLRIEATVTPGADARAFAVRLGSGPNEFVVELPVAGRGPVAVLRAGRPLALRGVRGGSLTPGRPARLEAVWFDHRLIVAVDGRPAFEPIDVDDAPASQPPPRGTRPPALGVLGGRLTVEGLRLDRDIYYTDSPVGFGRRPFGVGEPYRLGPGEYFVLGDNSPVSNDSRFWAVSPVVPAARFLGKPFLVHLPSRVVPLRVFGRELSWIPDPREIRYIR